MLIGQLIVCTCYVILYFSKVLFINYFCTAMIGVGNGFCVRLFKINYNYKIVYFTY